MAPLRNSKRERFAQELAKGKTADEAYAEAGYKPNRHNAARLTTNEHIRVRVAAIQERASKSVEITTQALAEELEQARQLALTNGQASAAVQATMGKAKLFGLIIEKKQHSGPNGGPIPTVDLTHATDEDLARLEALLGPLTSGADSADGDTPDLREAR
jgi:hypothetical protein